MIPSVRLFMTGLLCVSTSAAQISRPHFVISTFAGTSDVGDGNAATGGVLMNPWDAVADSSGNIFVADTNQHRIRRIGSDGKISTVAGTGIPGFRGDSGRAAEAQVAYPEALAIDNSGNLYFADTGNNRVRMISADGLISTVAGNGAVGFYGDGQQATSAAL